MGALFGLLTSFSITSSEFFGRRITNEIGPIVAASAISALAAIVTVVIAVAVEGDPTPADLLRGGASGISFGVGMTFYLQGVRVSSSAVVGPVVAALSTLIPFTYGSIVEEVPPALGLAGAATAVVGLLFVTMGGSEASNVGEGLPMGIVSGLGYGSGTALLIDVSSDSGAWPLVTQRGVAFFAIASFALVCRRPLIPPQRLAGHALGAGLFAGCSSALLLAGLNANAPAASVTASLFPASSVAAGRVFFRDSVSVLQFVGLLIVIGGTVAIVLA